MRLRSIATLCAVATIPLASGLSSLACSRASLTRVVQDDDVDEHVGDGVTQPADDTHGVVPSPPRSVVHGEIRGIAREAPVAALPHVESVTPSPIFSFTTGTSSTTNINIGGSPADSTVAASTTHVCLTARDAFACYTRHGDLVGLGDGLPAQPINAQPFFAASGLTIQPPPYGTPTKDARIVFDEHTQRFFLVFQTRETKNNPPGQTQGGRLAIAVSKSQDPRDGWYTWLDDDGANYDYGYLGVTSQYLVATELASDGAHHLMFPTSELVAGQQFYSRLKIQSTAMDGSVPCVNVTSSPDVYWVHRDDPNHVSVYDYHAGGLYHAASNTTIQGTPITGCGSGATFTNPPLSILQQNGSTTATVGFCINFQQPKMCEVRNGTLTWVSEDTIQAPDSTTHLGAHLVQMNVTNVVTGTATIVHDRIFGISSANDPAGSIFDYGMPAVGTNSLGDIVVGEVRTNATSYPDLRASVWPHGASDIDSSVSIGLGPAGSTPIGTYHMGGAAVDPSSTGVYLSQMVPLVGSPYWAIKVNKMLGSTMPDLYPQSVSAPATVTHGVAFDVQLQVVNQGDEAAGQSVAALYYTTNAQHTIDPSTQSAVAVVFVPALPAGGSYQTTVTVTLPSAGQGALGLYVNATSTVPETNTANDINPLLATPHGNALITVQ